MRRSKKNKGKKRKKKRSKWQREDCCMRRSKEKDPLGVAAGGLVVSIPWLGGWSMGQLIVSLDA